MHRTCLLLSRTSAKAAPTPLAEGPPPDTSKEHVELAIRKLRAGSHVLFMAMPVN